MKLRVLGSCGAYPSAGRACSSYLVEENGTRLLLDIGSGSFQNLIATMAPEELDGILVTHLHPDHYSDIYVFDNYLKYGIGSVKRVHYLSPKGPPQFDWPASFDVEVIEEGQGTKIGSIKLEFLSVEHADPSYAVKVSGEAVLVYSGDTKYSENLNEFARGADILLAEASFGGEKVPPGINHMNASEAATSALLAQVDLLVLTHIYPQFDETRAKEDAVKIFGENVSVAREGLVEEVA